VFIRHFGDQTQDGSYVITPSTLSIMTSMINVGELVGSLSAAPLNDILGRKGVFMTGTFAIIVGVILQLVSDSNRNLITAGRAIL
jgi:MFS transporter, SP family, sugar:H+ symporter